jgi:hypothetical protein
MIGGAGLTVTWFLAVHSQSTSGQVQTGGYSWLPKLFIAIALLGAALWVVRIVNGRRENPDGATLGGIAKDVAEIKAAVITGKEGKPELITSTAAGPKYEGSTVVFGSAGTLSTAVGTGPVLITPPPEGLTSLPLPAGTTVSLRSVTDEARTDDSVSRGHIPRSAVESARTDDHLSR